MPQLMSLHAERNTLSLVKWIKRQNSEWKSKRKKSNTKSTSTKSKQPTARLWVYWMPFYSRFSSTMCVPGCLCWRVNAWSIIASERAHHSHTMCERLFMRENMKRSKMRAPFIISLLFVFNVLLFLFFVLCRIECTRHTQWIWIIRYRARTFTETAFARPTTENLW